MFFELIGPNLVKMNTTKFIKVAGMVGQQAQTEDLSTLDFFKAFFRMMMDWISGRYSPKKRNILIGTLVLIYVISPLDFLPGIILDDAVVVLFALKYFKKEIANYLIWEKSRKLATDFTDAEIVDD